MVIGIKEYLLSANGIEMNAIIARNDDPIKSILIPNHRDVTIFMYHALVCSF